MKRTKKGSAKMNMRHYRTLTCRYARQLVSKPASFIMLICQVPVMLLILRATYFADSFTNPVMTPFANTTLFIIVFIGSLMGLLNSYREITKERDVLARETAGGLDSTAYVMSKITVHGVIALFQGTLLVLGSLIFIDFGFKTPALGITVFIITEVSVIWVSAALGLFVSAVVKNSESAVLPVLLIIICQVVFSGTLFEPDGAASYIGWLCPAMWGAAIFGKMLSFNTLLPEFTRAVYDFSYLRSFLALAIMMVVLVSATISVVAGKGIFQRKKNKR